MTDTTNVMCLARESGLSCLGTQDHGLSLQLNPTGHRSLKQLMNVFIVGVFSVVPLHRLLVCVIGKGDFDPTDYERVNNTIINILSCNVSKSQVAGSLSRTPKELIF